MIALPRALAQRFRAVLRRSLMNEDGRGPWPIVLCRTDPGGLSLEARQGDVAVRYQQPGALPADAIAFPGTLLAEIEGRTDAPVTLETTAEGKTRAHWSERGVPRVHAFATLPLDIVPPFPDLADRLRPQPAEFRRALGDAAATVARDAVRYATNRMQLRGKSGELVATDGRQLLLQGGFSFPWTDDVLVPALAVFATRDLPEDQPVTIGRTATAVTLGVGPWTLVLTIDAKGRFPAVETVIPKLSATTSRLHFDPADAAFLVEALPKLPGDTDDGAPVTLALGRPPTLSAWSADGGPAAEVVLARSSASSTPLRLRTDRQFLRRALRMGFTELHAVSGDKPVCCRDRRRCYVWVPLDPKPTVPAGAETLRIVTTGADGIPPPPIPAIPAIPADPERRTAPMSTTPANGDAHRDRICPVETAAPGSLAEVIAETEALRDVLHDAFSRTTRLLAALKLQRRQTKAVQQAMASLKQLQLDR